MPGPLSRAPRRLLIVAVACLGLAALLLSVLWASSRTGVLIATDARRQRILLCEPVVPGDAFVVEYTHSSEKIPVVTTFAVAPDWELAIEETAFASFGPGLPELQQGELYEISGGMIRARHHGDRLAELSFFVHPFTDHRLRVGKRTVELSRRVAPGGLVKIRVESTRFPGALFRRWSACPSSLAGSQPAKPGS